MAYKHDYDKTLYRLNTILSRLNDGEALSVKDLASEFNVSERTIQRDFNERLVSLYPIYQEKRLWRMQSGFKLEKQNSSEDDLILGILKKLTEGMGTVFSAKAKSILSKVHNESENPIYAKNSMEDISTHLEEIQTLTKAIETKHCITCTYAKDRAPVRKRTIKPLKVVTFDGFWYLVGLNEEDEIRKYYLKNITHIHITDTTFESTTEIDKRLQDAVSIWFNAEKEPFKVQLRADAEIAKYFKRKPLATQTIEEEMDDGSIVLSLMVTNDVEVMQLVKCRLPHLHIIEPMWIKEKIDEELNHFLCKKSHCKSTM